MRAHAVAVLVALAGAAIVSGCDGGGPAEPTGGPSALSVGRSLQTADCSDWKRLSLRERYEVVDHLEEVVDGPRGEGTTLPDDKAYDVIDGRCENYYARGFLLYEMYTRAASFYAFTQKG